MLHKKNDTNNGNDGEINWRHLLQSFFACFILFNFTVFFKIELKYCNMPENMSENILEKSFLYRIAEKYYQTYGNEIHGFSFVFPNRRAGLFFQKYLTQVVQQPIFSPEIMTINDCFAQAAEYQTADR